MDYQNNGQNDNRTVENNTNDYVIRDQGKFDSDTTLFIVLGVVEAVVCSMLCGALAAVFAFLATDEARHGREDIGEQRFRVAKILLIVGLVLGILRLGLVVFGGLAFGGLFRHMIGVL